ncbi:uncharacterized protein BJ171DRAFT_584762 [Polychytrium aggregatum]|uniref:uncharacterized protein n=1 Tax=Polychytrium aggregatum TaxID=110093 RepID=UPI0022FE5F83|nr:uncharacterized protein BJ171DRAFT_584762 [Polychytrium aggregatum]KAI9201865.1 hypothetical protein BJ171DRAFT_584762 [Polychytrium aggregatum]
MKLSMLLTLAALLVLVGTVQTTPIVDDSLADNAEDMRQRSAARKFGFLTPDLTMPVGGLQSTVSRSDMLSTGSPAP